MWDQAVEDSNDDRIALYLGKRDFVDHVESVDIVDGVIKVDPAELEGRKVWVYLACSFRYGSDDLDLIGMNYRKDIWIQRQQIYPVVGTKPANTPMQEALLKKCEDQGHAFTFNIDNNLPCSVGLQPAPEDVGKACGVDYEVKAYIANEADDPDEKINKKDTCRLIIRKIQFAPGTIPAGPHADISKNFMMSDKLVHLEASIEKEVGLEEVKGESTLEKTFTVIPLLSNNKEKRGLAVDGRLKDEDTNLASTTL
ncbi:unnamed protein product [Coregonus sp. 'balchen']|nr:unnamed protein product [Coregonus sp. 'balchen']